MGNESNNLYEFRDFRFAGGTGKLWKNNALILLSPKASELLGLLLERAGEFVSKEEIFAKVWADTFVEDGVLTQNIYTLRKILGNDEDGKPLIENRTRLGYRITVPIRIVENAPTQPNFVGTQGKKIDFPDFASKDQKSETSFREPKFERTENEVLTEPFPAKTKKRRINKSLFFFAVPILLLPMAFFGWNYLRPNLKSLFRKPIERVKFTKLTNTGDLNNAVISPDGNLMAFTRENILFLKDLNTEKELKIDIPNVNSFNSLQFSPDGNSIYFRNNKILSTQTEILKVSRFGGETETVVGRSWGSFRVSPDGKKIAYFLNVPPVAKFNLKVRNLETAEEKEFFAVEQPNSVCGICAPAWSPDSSKIIFTTNIPNGTGQMFLVNLENDTKDEMKFEKLRRFEQAAWSPEGDSFIVSATDGSRFFHLWKVSYPEGEIEPMTNGLSNYGRLSISSDGKKILALQTDEVSNIFVADARNLNEMKQVTLGNQNSFGQNGLNWIDERRILYSTQTEQNLADNLAVLNLEDNSRTPLTNEKQNSFRVPTSDGKNIWFTMNKDGTSHIFQMDIDGKNIKQLTTGNDGLRQSPRVTNDSKYLYYVLRGKEGGKILRFDLQNQTEEVFFNNADFQPGPFLELSPDNKYLTFLRMGNRTDDMIAKFNAVMTVVSIENTNQITFFPVSMVPPIRRFSPDSKSIDYIYGETDMTQIVRQSFNGKDLKPIYTTTEGSIFNFAWSRDGKKLAIARGQQLRDAVLLTDIE